MKVASLAEIKARLSAFIDESAATGPVVITRNGRAAAVLVVPKDDDDLEDLMLSRSPKFQAILDSSRASIRKGKALSRDDFWKAVKSRGRKPATNQGKRPKEKTDR